jgi:hypothetical protein
VVPRLGWCKPALALVVSLILSGCGGGGSAKQAVTGAGFSFEAPAGWVATSRGSASNGAVDLLEVRTFTLLKPYRHARLAGAVRELDDVIERIAKKLDARVTSRQTRTVARRDARSYRLEYDGKLQEITFVLDGTLEYELICRLARGEDDTACSEQRRTFALT